MRDLQREINNLAGMLLHLSEKRDATLKSNSGFQRLAKDYQKSVEQAEVAIGPKKAFMEEEVAFKFKQFNYTITEIQQSFDKEHSVIIQQLNAAKNRLEAVQKDYLEVKNKVEKLNNTLVHQKKELQIHADHEMAQEKEAKELRNVYTKTTDAIQAQATNAVTEEEQMKFAIQLSELDAKYQPRLAATLEAREEAQKQKSVYANLIAINTKEVEIASKELFTVTKEILDIQKKFSGQFVELKEEYSQAQEQLAKGRDPFAEQAKRERVQKEQAERERIQKEQAERERIQKEQAERERIQKEQAERERIQKEQQLKAQRERAQEHAEWLRNQIEALERLQRANEARKQFEADELKAREAAEAQKLREQKLKAEAARNEQIEADELKARALSFAEENRRFEQQPQRVTAQYGVSKKVMPQVASAKEQMSYADILSTATFYVGAATALMTFAANPTSIAAGIMLTAALADFATRHLPKDMQGNKLVAFTSTAVSVVAFVNVANVACNMKNISATLSFVNASIEFAGAAKSVFIA